MTKINIEQFEGHTAGPWYRQHSNDTIRSLPLEEGDDPEQYLFDIVGATTTDAELAAAAPELLKIVKAAHAYSDYIMDAFNEEFGEDSGQTAIEAGWEPVCFMEFYDNEWQLQNE
jgi:hypothetical protein